MSTPNTNPGTTAPTTTTTPPEGTTPDPDGEMIPRSEVNKALNALGARHRKEITALKDEVAAQFAALSAPKETDPPGAPGKDPELVKLQKQVQAQQEAIEQRERMIAEEKARQQDSFTRQTLHESLTAMGVKPELAPFVISHLYADQKKVKNKDGSLVYETGEEIEPEIDFKKGIEKFLKTPIGQHFIAPKQVAGTGANPREGRTSTIGGQQAPSIAEFLKTRRSI